MKKSGNAEERILDTAERMFADRGYSSVRLNQIASEVKVKTASLYYYYPGGKEELFLKVMERAMGRHLAGLHRSIGSAGPGWREKLEGAASWFLSQPRMDMFRMLASDMEEIGKEHAESLSWLIFRSVMEPVASIFVQAQAENPRPLPHPQLLTGSFLSIIQGIQFVPAEFARQDRMDMARQMIRVLAEGLEPRSHT